MIRYLENKDIDKSKWDSCISGALNKFPYAYSWYLDIVAPNWAALVSNDYDIVMPLPVKRKMGISYVYIPYFAQQLGIFCGKIPDHKKVIEFIATIPAKFRLVEISMNGFVPLLKGNFITEEKNNFEMDINRPYNEIYSDFSRNCTRNLKKSESANLSLRENISPDIFVGFVRKNLADQIAGLRAQHFLTLGKLIAETLSNKTGSVIGAFSSAGNLCAVASFIETEKRCIFSICASSHEGKGLQAMHFLVNTMIKRRAGKKQVFDFSGSNIEGIAYFNKSFGAVNKPYQILRINRLPWFLKLLK